MDDTFKTLIDGLHNKYQDLISMSPVTIDTTPNNCPVGGVYLFSENGKPLYAGRTKRNIKTRLKGHVNTAKDCPAILGEGMKNRLSLDFLLGGCFSTQEVRGKWQP